MMKLPAHHALIAGCAAVLLTTAAFGGGVMYVALHRAPTVASVPVPPPFPSQVLLNPASIAAQSAILYDPTNGRILFAKDAGTSRPLASLTKLMTATVVLSQKTPEEEVEITPQDLAPGGDWDGGLKVGQQVTLHELLTLGLVASSNDAIAAAAASLGTDPVVQMNTTAQELGLTHTHFLNPTGLDVSTSTAGAYGSAYDVARLAATFYKKFPDYFSLTAQPSVSVTRGSQTLTAAATAAPLLSTPGFVGAKTGYTDLAGGNLVAVFDIEIGHPLVAVVLGSTEQGRYTDIRTLIAAARNAH